jgi:hypothetical protein
MRSNLQSRLGEEGEFRAEIKKTREFVRNEKLVREYVLENVTNDWGTITTDHLIWRLGREVPRIPIIYGRLGRGMRIKFIGKVIEYKKYAGIDYSVTLIRLLEAVKI